MVTYTCEKCNKIFKQKVHYKTHLNKKNPCMPTVSIAYNELNKEPLTSKIVKEKMDNNLCPYCDKTFTRKDTIVQHMKNHCKILKQMESEDKTISQHLVSLTEQISSLTNKINRIEKSYATIYNKDNS